MLEPSAMFSLYRSWLMREPPPPPSCVTPDASAPPDVWLEVGGSTRFAAHSTLLAAHSGYLRAALCANRPPNEPPLPNTAAPPLSIPNITAEQFAPLLSYMYSGHLDLNSENIFPVLLAAHVLHMPRALDICRGFLAQHQLVPEPMAMLPSFVMQQSSGVIKPIASRHLVPATPRIPAVAPVYQGLFQSSQNTSFRSLDTPVREVHVTAEAKGIAAPSSNNEPELAEAKNTTRIKQKRQIASTAHAQGSKSKTSTNIKNAIPQQPQLRAALPTEDTNDKVIVDIASCDGPVRFSRVLNTAYNAGVSSTPNASAGKISRDTDRALGGTSFNTQMAENIRNYSAEYNRSETGSSDSEEINIEDVNTSEKSLNVNEANSGETIYTCVYCKHTFKSQYCYQKHARRHLHPVESNQQSLIAAPSIEVKEKQPQVVQETKREVRPLDMNVQYYPCKTCGSKFPSYYFVHKHRKMCHSEERNELI